MIYCLSELIKSTMEKKSLDKILQIVRSLNEEVPTNSLAGGQIAGTVEAGDDPPVKPRKKKKYIYMKGVRKIWKPEDGGAS
jgi:hypothetical protein